jgi:coenzyme F420-reducing hydrogenase alpha subunit
MATTITIDPVTRIEGHARVLLDLADDNSVESARLIVNELRGFERMLVGMEADRMPLVTARVCGVCPVSHALASIKALEAAFGVTAPPAALLLRQLLSAGQLIHSHALHLFAIAGPDLYFGLSGDPAKRNIVELVDAAPDLAKKALRLRTLGQKMVEAVGGRGVHPVTVVIGGSSFDLPAEKRAALEKQVDEMLALAKELAPTARDLLQNLAEKEPRLLDLAVPSHDLGLVQDGKPNHADGTIRLTTPDGKVAAEIPARDYAKHMIEHSFDWSYMKPVGFLLGGEEVTYRVGALARVNVVDAMGTPLAQAELEAFRKAVGRPCHIALMYNWARIVEILWACERAKSIISDPVIGGPARIPVRIGAGRGVGCVEAPRGTLIHEYEVDERGIVRMANLLIATQQNYASINRSLEQAAGEWVAGKGDAAVLNAVEFALRCYDPCLSCATHAVGRMPIEIEMRKGGEIVRRLRRED